MYATCPSCRTPLGTNAALEHFQVGRRLAFDPLKGRLWALCRQCRGWNLAPIEERWEAVEEAERLFETAARGPSTENVGLGRVAEGTELVRVGPAERAEISGWRYGRELGQAWLTRRNRGFVAVGAGAGLFLLLPFWAWGAGVLGYAALLVNRPLFRTGQGTLVRMSAAHSARLLPDSAGEGWRIEVPTSGAWLPDPRGPTVVRRGREPLVLEEQEGLRALRAILPRVNHDGGTSDQVTAAVGELNRMSSPDALIRSYSEALESMSFMRWSHHRPPPRPHLLATADPVLQLAMEMAVNEEAERRALEGEVALLEREWREAEELAAISDDLLFPSALRGRLARIKAGLRRESRE
jgi:hypothetical protein